MPRWVPATHPAGGGARWDGLTASGDTRRIAPDVVAFRLSRDARLVRFGSTDGLRLEGRLTVAARGRGVVLCHPHPLYGGSMLTPVILTAEQTFQDAGYTTLAFNFRGVGGSEGTHGRGRAELADVRGALDFLQETLGPDATDLAVVGYSFGSVVGGRAAAADPRVTLYLGIAPPLRSQDFGFLAGARCRVALVAGSRDHVVDAERLATLASRPGVWFRVLDTDHFFAGALGELATACRDAIAWARDQGAAGREHRAATG